MSEALRALLPGRLELFARERPERVALREKTLGVWREIPWREYRDEVAATARRLHDLGVRPGDAVAILSDNRTEWLYADLGAQSLGARAVGVYQTNPPEDVAYVLAHSGSRVLVCEDQEQVDKAIACREQTPGVEVVVVLEPRGTTDYDDPRLVTWEAFITEGRKAVAQDPSWFAARLAERDPKEPTMVVYTSGTTGRPKGAMISSANVVPIAEGAGPVLGVTDGDQLLSYLPLCHVAEKIFTVFLPLTWGAVVHFGESIETVQADLREVSPTVFLGVPRIWEKMAASVQLKMRDSSRLKRALYDWASARGHAIAERRREGRATALDRLTWFVADLLVFRPLQERLGLRRCRLPISGAAPISADLLRWFHGIGVPISEGFGMTECGGVSHANPPGRVRIGTVGPPLPGVACSLAEDGEILIEGPCVFEGYLHDEEATRESIDEQGRLHTGDIGSIDADGYLSITGRKKEILITAGGKNLSPEKIENALKTSPYIKEALAIGDARKFVSALIQIEYDTVGHWAARRELPYTSFADLAGKEEVVKLIEGEVRKTERLLARVEQVRAFRLLPKELHQDDGELTATQKVRRREVQRIHAALIEAMYGGAATPASEASKEGGA